MAICVSLSKGFKLPCKVGSAGIKAVSLVPFDAAITFTAVTAGELTDIPSGITAVYTYDTMNDGSNYTETITSDKQTRSTTFAGALNLVMPKITTDLRNEVLMLTKGQLWIFVEDFNGNVYLVGKDNGAELVGGTIATGGARTDLNGYTLNFVTLENESMVALSTSAKTEYYAAKVLGV